MKMIKLAIVGTGGMANAHAEQFKKIKGVKLVAGVDVDIKKLQEFNKKHGIPNAYTSVQELLKHEDFDAATVVTPDAFHVSCALPLINAGKHVLCEKPLAPIASEAKKLVMAAKKAKVINMVNFSYRDAPALQKVNELVKTGQLGQIMHFEAHYLQTWLSSPVWGDWKTKPAWLWRLSTSHGSMGVLGDIGVHIVDLATFACNEQVLNVNALLKTFPKGIKNKMKGYTLDANDSAILRVELQGGGIGSITTTRWAAGQTNSLALFLYGKKGGIRLDLDKSRTELEVCLGKDLEKVTWKTIKCKQTPNNYQRFIKSIRSGKNEQADFQRGWEIQKILDASIASDQQKKTIVVK